MPSPGKALALSDYDQDMERVETELSELAPIAFTEPFKTAETTLYVYRIYARTSLNGNLRELRAVEAAIDKALAAVGPAEDLCLLKANLNFKLHRLSETKRALALAPALANRRQGQMLLADIDFQHGAYAAARSTLETLAAEEPTWDVLARLAHIEAKLGDASKADDLYLRAEDELTAKEMRSFAWVELQRGLLDLSHGRVDDALAHYDCAERAYSGSWLTTEHIADALASAPHYEKVVLIVDKPEVAEKLGKLYAAAGETTRAENLFSHALDIYMESANRGEVHYYHHLVDFFAEVRHNGDEALKWARKDLALRDNFNTQTAVAWALHSTGQSTAALPYIEQALGSGVTDAAIFTKAAAIFDAAHDHTRAHQCRHLAEHLNPTGIHAHTH